MNEIFMQIVIDIIDFFANCEDATIEEDTAVKMLEKISFYLKQLSIDEKEIFIQYSKTLADQFKGKNDEKSDFYYKIPEYLGLEESKPR